jgi:hypothetical protein
MDRGVENGVDETKKEGGTAASNRTMRPRAPKSANPPAALDSNIQNHIGRELRAVYDQIVNEPVPDRFLKLLAELEKKQPPV